MAFVVKDRIKETTTTTGTGGTYNLGGAATGGYQDFSVIGHYNTTYYACTDGTNWEVGEAYYNGTNDTLVRQSVIESSNSNNAVDWGSGTKDIFVTLPASKALVLDDQDDYKIDAGDDIIIGANQSSSANYLAIQHFGTTSTIQHTAPSIADGTFNLKGGRFNIQHTSADEWIYADRIGGNNRVKLYGGDTAVLSTNLNGSGVSITGALSVTGDLTVNGTTTTVNSTTVTIDDPVFTLGGDAAPSTDDNKDRGIEFRWHNGSAAKLGFFGFDDSEGKLTFIPDATNTSEVFSGTVGTILANLQGNVTGNADTASTADFLTGLADPDADRLLMWDDSAGAHKFVTLGSNLAFSGTTLNATDTNTDTTYTAGSGLSLTGTTFANTAPDQTVTLTGAGATSISGTYPNFTITSTDTDTNTTYSAGSGLSLTGTTFANTAPDQTVTLTGAGSTSISGTYPNFTITSTDTDTNTTYTAGTGISLSGTEFAIDTSVVPQLGQNNVFNGDITLSYQDKIEWTASGSQRLVIQDGAGVSYFRNYAGRLDIEGDDVRINYMSGGTTHTGLQVRNPYSTNAAGSICWNSSIKVEASPVGANVTGNIAVTGTVDGVDIAARDAVLTTTTTTANAALPKAGGTMTGAIRQDQDSLTASGGTLTIDLSASNNFKVTMTASTTFAFSNKDAGRYGNIIIVQDATGGRSFTLPTECKTPVNGASIVQATNANEISVLSYYVVDANTILVNYIGDFA